MWYLQEHGAPLPVEDWVHGGGEHYYVFLEDVALLDPRRAIEGPDGLLLERHPVFEDGPARFRLSGVEVDRIHAALDTFEPLRSAAINDEQRARRRRALLEMFAMAAVPTIDFYIWRHDPRSTRLMRTLVPATWHVLRLDEMDPAGAEIPIYLGEPDAARPAPAIVGGALVDLFPVEPWLEDRLRDIFSLNHLPDARFEGETGGGLTPSLPPSPPPDDDSMVAAKVKMTAPEPVAEAEDRVYYTVRPTKNEDPQQVTVSS
jgi:hypothetical protein